MVMSGERKHYAGRWICQKPTEKCDGFFNVESFGKISCPLASKCLVSPHRLGQLESVYLPAHFGRLSIQSDPDWNIKHATRLNELKAAFTPEVLREYFQDYRNRHRDKLNKLHREKYSISLDKMGFSPKTAFKTVSPPCGGDCRNCPFDNGCHFPDWDEQMDKKREAKRRGAKKYAMKRRERMLTDPAYAEHERAKARAYTRAYRMRIKNISGVKRKADAPFAPRCGYPHIGGERRNEAPN